MINLIEMICYLLLLVIPMLKIKYYVQRIYLFKTWPPPQTGMMLKVISEKVTLSHGHDKYIIPCSTKKSNSCWTFTLEYVKWNYFFQKILRVAPKWNSVVKDLHEGFKPISYMSLEQKQTYFADFRERYHNI